jgi:pantoate--beta-alanine ligase
MTMNQGRLAGHPCVAMQVIEHISEMQSWGENQRRKGRRLVLVPTMGFLHEGHLSLVREAKKRGDRIIVSIFVNPAQFTPQEDFAAYPRDFERDRRLLEQERTHVLFNPSVDEIYPQDYQTHIQVEKLSDLFCGRSRPGHFRGVATIVAKLFNIVRPHVAVFGCKDYQQLQVIRRMVADLNFAIEIVAHPTVREPDGLAMSSRNAYLNRDERQAALCLSRSLRQAESLASRGERRGAAIVDAVLKELRKEQLAHVEYVGLCDPENLQEIEQIENAAVLLLAVRIGKARLIDNTILKP